MPENDIHSCLTIFNFHRINRQYLQKNYCSYPLYIKEIAKIFSTIREKTFYQTAHFFRLNLANAAKNHPLSHPVFDKHCFARQFCRSCSIVFPQAPGLTTKYNSISLSVLQIPEKYYRDQSCTYPREFFLLRF